ncbi:hypothetical protein NHQ30_000323 [Ciborinia camelliae]|nr:hypothetical protein NHQ30_000323 [Ciborinia camelliae]
MMSLQRPKDNPEMPQRSPNKRRASQMNGDTSDDEDNYTPPNKLHASVLTRDDASGDDDNYVPNAESDEEELLASSSSKKVTFDTSANMIFTTPVAPPSPPPPSRHYVPDFDSLPKNGVWVSPAPGKHVHFQQIVVRTTKCDICNKKAGTAQEKKDGKVMQRCCDCNTQFCMDCETKVSRDKRHFPQLDQLVWEPQTKPNATTRPTDNFKSNMYSKPKSEAIPSRPLTASERLAGMRTIAPATYVITTVNTAAPSRPSRARPSKAASAKKAKKNSRTTPPRYTADEVDAHYELDLEYIQKLPPSMQRKEKKEADARNLERKLILETMETENPYNPQPQPISTLNNNRTPLPTSGTRFIMSRPMVTPRPMATRRQTRRSAKQQAPEQRYESTSETNARIATPIDSENASESLRHILDGLSKNRQASEQAHPGMEFEKSDLSYEHGATLFQDEYHQDYLQDPNVEAGDGDYEPIYNRI